MKKARYVKRLEKMLKKYAGTSEFGVRCPAALGFNFYFHFVSKKTCAICQTFVHLNVISGVWGCPCNRLDPEEAANSAKKAIEGYKKERKPL